jgi:hypothetical protein
MGYTIEVNAHGALFDGRAAPAIDRALRDAQWDVGSQGLSNWHAFLDSSIRNPTPYYETQVTVQRVATDVVVHDRGVIYGPWLEGVSQRNQTTRFKGYAAFRKATQEMERKAGPIAERILQQHLKAAN